jgi:hypothetical protein
MAGTLDEIAHGIVTVLHGFPDPEPLEVALRGHTYEQAIYLAQAVADECSASATTLARIQIGEPRQFELGGAERKFEGGAVGLERDVSVGAALRFYRWVA